MTQNLSIVQQAVTLLRTRLDELDAERTEIVTALDALTHSSSRAAYDLVTPSPKSVALVDELKRNANEGTVRHAVLDLFNAENRVLSNDEVVATVAPLFPQRPADKLRANVRSTLFQLVASGVLVKLDRGQHIASMWRPANAESPAATTGLSDLPDLTPNGGEHTDGQGSHHDHRIDFAGRNSDRDHLGAPVGH
jgi:hypothetical protein